MKGNISLGTRLLSMLVDHAIMTVIIVLLFSPLILNSLNNDSVVISSSATPIAAIGIFLYFCKDSFGGRSLAKRWLNLKVVDNLSGEIASPLKCFIRNMFCIIWPIEIIVTFKNPNRRIGDIVAGTKVLPNI